MPKYTGVVCVIRPIFVCECVSVCVSVCALWWEFEEAVAVMEVLCLGTWADVPSARLGACPIPQPEAALWGAVTRPRRGPCCLEISLQGHAASCHRHSGPR